MSVLNYLTQRASGAVLSTAEKSSIETSISALSRRLNLYFDDVTEHFQFGSSTRGTILPRSMDSKSDIDYMVVFEDDGCTVQTYLNRLKRFVECYYSTSEISQSYPTIVLNLNHIKFELVPAKNEWFQYYIPDSNGSWVVTDPNNFNQSLTDKNNSHSSLIKPTIRLAKYWNASNGYVFNSYLFEKWVVDQGFWVYPENQKTCLFHVFDQLSQYDQSTQWRRDKITRAKEIVGKVREYENDNMPYTAEEEVKKLIPE